MPRAKAEYKPYSHTSVDYGYQNPTIARRFAKFVASTLKEKGIVASDVSIVGLDGSSIFLAAFVKAVLPKLEFISCSKYSERQISTNRKYLLFADDYFCSGSATKEMIQRVWGFDDLPDLICMYIKASISKEKVEQQVKTQYIGKFEVFIAE